MKKSVIAKRSLALFAFTILSPIAISRAADNWPRWRGPGDNGSTESPATYPAKFDADHVLWKVTLPGKGCSTPIVWGDRIFVTAPVSGHDAALAYDMAGKPLWQTTFGEERSGKNRNGSGCNPSPATDGKHLFVYFKSGNLAGLDLDGKILWKTNLQERYGHDSLYWDLGTSPVLTEKDVVVAVMHHGGSYIAAFDKLTGDLHWKVSRDYPTPTEGDHSYASPIVLKQDGKEVLMAFGAEHVTVHDVADGHVISTCGGFNPKHKSNWVCVASAVIAGDIAVIPYGRGSQLHGVNLAGTGDVTATARIWERDDTGSFVPTPAEYKGRVYLLHDDGVVECIDPATGKTDWTGHFPHKSPKFYASPTIADGKLYAAREDGAVYVARIAGGFELLSENNMGEKIIASPVPVGGKLLVRGEERLFCVREN